MKWTAPQAVEMTKREASLLYSHSFNQKRGKNPATAGPFGDAFLFGNYCIAVATRTTFILCTPGADQGGIPNEFCWTPKNRIVKHGQLAVGDLGTVAIETAALGELAKVSAHNIRGATLYLAENGRFGVRRPLLDTDMFFDPKYLESRHKEWRRSIAETLKLEQPPHAPMWFNGNLLEIVGEVGRAAHGTTDKSPTVCVTMYAEKTQGGVAPKFVIEANGRNGCWFVMIEGLKTKVM